jgi:hypothetical protein
MTSRGAQFPDYDASVLTDELSFTALILPDRLTRPGHRQETP